MTGVAILDVFKEWSISAIMLRLTFAVVFGVLIGLDRSVKRRGAGIKTHTVVCLGAALVMITGQYIYMNFDASNYIDRLPAQVITGVGFLGVGTILVTGRNQVRGLTTAAGLWTCACVGLAIGIGFIEGAAFTVFLIIFIFKILTILDNWLHRNSKVFDIYIEFESNKSIALFIDLLRREKVKIDSFELSKMHLKGDGPNAIATIEVQERGKREEFLYNIRKLDYISFVEEL